MRKKAGPLPSVHWARKVDSQVMEPLSATVSGEITASRIDVPLGAPRFAGEVTGVYLSVANSGKDDSNELNITGEVYINAVSCLTTAPSIAHISGEDAQNKTTVVTGDTGILQGVVDKTANTFSPGDVFTASFLITRTASPTTEIMNPVVVVELEPSRKFSS